MSDLTQAVMAKDLGALEIASREGVAAIPELQSLLANPDPQVRLFAVLALGAIPQPEAITLLIPATTDKHGQVAVEAVNQLEKYRDKLAAKYLLQALERAPDPTARRRLSLLLGWMALADEDLAKLAKLCQDESVEEAKIGCLAALARMGNPDAETAFKRRVDKSSGRERVEIIRLLEYIGQRWIIATLGELLTDKSQAIFRNLDLRPDQPQFLRVCDLAANAIVRLTRARVSFAQSPPINYSPVQLDEVRNLARSVR